MPRWTVEPDRHRTVTTPRWCATVSLTAVAVDAKGRVVRDRVRWSSTAPGVMSVDSTGLVTAVGLGAGTIRAQVGVATATTLITVAQRPARI